ncbi:hypothetical protein F5Y11DRAFT_308246 [Daldinia sp. FL1419]|nr:hypothetical protein F5Y11DRAFT_308246 [Daldinia sp. FL1419]
MASDKIKGSQLVPFSQATEVTKLDGHTYKAYLGEAFCLGTGATKSPPYLILAPLGPFSVS